MTKSNRVETTHTQSEMIKEAEALLVGKYPHLIKGTLANSGDHADFGSKRTCEIACSECMARRRLPTSDLFHVKRCVACTKASKKKPLGAFAPKKAKKKTKAKKSR